MKWYFQYQSIFIVWAWRQSVFVLQTVILDNTGHCISITSSKLNRFYFIYPYLYGDLRLSLESHPVSILILPWEKPLDYVLGRFGWNQSCFSYPNKSSQSPRLLSHVQRRTWSNAKISLEVFPEHPYHWISALPKYSAWCHFLPNCFQNNAGTAAWSSALRPSEALAYKSAYFHKWFMQLAPPLLPVLHICALNFCQDKHTVMLLTELDQTAGLAENESSSNSQPNIQSHQQLSLSLLQYLTTHDSGERAGS